MPEVELLKQKLMCQISRKKEEIVNISKCWFFEKKINKIHKPLVNLMKKKEEGKIYNK